MVVCRLLMYTLMDWSPAEYIAFSTAGYSQSPPAPYFAVVLVIRCSSQWWNAGRTLSISPVTTQIFLPYINTYCATAFWFLPGPATFLPSFLAPLLSPPTAIELCAGLGIPQCELSVHCCLEPFKVSFKTFLEIIGCNHNMFNTTIFHLWLHIIVQFSI